MVRSWHSLAVVPVIAVVGSGACGGDAGGPATGFAVRDSAGVVIVESRVLAAEIPTWQLAGTPEVDIGGDEADPSQQLFSVSGAARLSDGRIVIAEDGNSRLRFHDGSGRWIRDVGRAGDGPGEFRDMSRPWIVAGDSIAIYDLRLRRFSLFSPVGEFVRTWPLEQPLPDDAVSPALLVAGNEWLARPGFSFSASTPTGIHQREVPYARFAFDGMYIDTVGRYAGAETYVYSEGGNSLAMSLPFLRSPSLAAAPGEGFWYGPADGYAIQRRGSDGHLSAIVRATDVDNRMPSGRVEAWVSDVLEQSEPDQRQFLASVFSALPAIETRPAYSALRTDAAGQLWVRDFVWSDESVATWRIFRPDGATAARIDLPSSLAIDQIGEDWLLGRWTDELEVEHVVLYRYARSEAPAGGVTP